MELTEMGVYLFFMCVFATLFQHPASPIRHVLPNSIVRRAFFGISIGATIVAIVLTPWGKQSGGHLNPAMTFTFFRLGKVEFWDAIFYGVVQFAGATAGVAIATSLLLGAPGNPAIRYAATLPGVYGAGVAFVAEVSISVVLMLTVGLQSHHALSLHTVFCRRAIRDSYYAGNAAVRNEHESCANVWLGTSRQLLACSLGLFSGADLRNAGRCRTFFTNTWRYRPVLRQTPSRS